MTLLLLPSIDLLNYLMILAMMYIFTPALMIKKLQHLKNVFFYSHLRFLLKFIEFLNPEPASLSVFPIECLLQKPFELG